MFRFFIFSLLFLLAFLLSIDNTKRVGLTFLIYSSPQWPLSWWLLAFFTLGVIVGYGVSLVSRMKQKSMSPPRDDHLTMRDEP